MSVRAACVSRSTSASTRRRAPSSPGVLCALRRSRCRAATNAGLASPGCAAPSGFLSLLTRCSATTRPALFHAGDTLGLSVFRGFPPPVAARASRPELPLPARLTSHDPRPRSARSSSPGLMHPANPSPPARCYPRGRPDPLLTFPHGSLDAAPLSRDVARPAAPGLPRAALLFWLSQRAVSRSEWWLSSSPPAEAGGVSDPTPSGSFHQPCNHNELAPLGRATVGHAALPRGGSRSPVARACSHAIHNLSTTWEGPPLRRRTIAQCDENRRDQALIHGKATRPSGVNARTPARRRAPGSSTGGAGSAG